jgi:hypothetical protein
MSSTLDIIGWLSEAGVPGADRDTPLSSLNLTWLLHRFEETTGRDAGLDPDQLSRARTVGMLADLLDRVRPSAAS